MKLAENFELKEFNCKCGEPVPTEYIKNVTVLAWILQRIRDHINQPLIINSGYRTEEYNRKVGGSNNSYHKTAKAVDFFAPALSSEALYHEIVHLMLSGAIPHIGIGVYKTFVHIDIRGHYVLFNYPF